MPRHSYPHFAEAVALQFGQYLMRNHDVLPCKACVMVVLTLRCADFWQWLPWRPHKGGPMYRVKLCCWCNVGFRTVSRRAECGSVAHKQALLHLSSCQVVSDSNRVRR